MPEFEQRVGLFDTGKIPAVIDEGRRAAERHIPYIGGCWTRAGRRDRPGADAGVARVLVVDDNPMNRDLLARRVARLGHTVVLAEHGRAAVDLLGAEPFDIVLLDVEMPELNGYEVLTWLKADPGRARIPVIMISAVHATPRTSPGA